MKRKKNDPLPIPEVPPLTPGLKFLINGIFKAIMDAQRVAILDPDDLISRAQLRGCNMGVEDAAKNVYEHLKELGYPVEPIKDQDDAESFPDKSSE